MHSYFTTSAAPNFSPIDKSVVKIAARGNWAYILSNLGIPEEFLKNRHSACPVCGGNDRFRFDDKYGAGTWFCNQCDSQSGDGFSLLMNFRRWTFQQALRAVSELLGGNHSPLPSNVARMPRQELQTDDPAQVERRRQAVLRTWKEGISISHSDPVDKYLRRRGIHLDNYPKDLRYHQCLGYWDADLNKIGDYPAMIASVRNLSGEIVSIHRTYLTFDGTKAPVNPVKKLMSLPIEGATRGAAIRLAEPGDVLAVAEGIETALAVSVIAAVPCWSVLSTSGMKSLEVPAYIREIWICADNDKAGVTAAKELAKKLRQKGLIVKIAIPNGVGKDWLDAMTGAC